MHERLVVADDLGSQRRLCRRCRGRWQSMGGGGKCCWMFRCPHDMREGGGRPSRREASRSGTQNAMAKTQHPPRGARRTNPIPHALIPIRGSRPGNVWFLCKTPHKHTDKKGPNAGASLFKWPNCAASATADTSAAIEAGTQSASSTKYKNTHVEARRPEGGGIEQTDRKMNVK